MEKKKKTRNFTQKSKPCRISKNLFLELEKIGDGDWKHGLLRSIDAHKALNKNPEVKLMNDVDMLMSDLIVYYSNNHYDHFSNFPACFRQFLRKGFQNWAKINKRYDKHIDEYKEKEDAKKSEQ